MTIFYIADSDGLVYQFNLADDGSPQLTLVSGQVPQVLLLNDYPLDAHTFQVTAAPDQGFGPFLQTTGVTFNPAIEPFQTMLSPENFVYTLGVDEFGNIQVRSMGNTMFVDLVSGVHCDPILTGDFQVGHVFVAQQPHCDLQYRISQARVQA